jgi:hypothetical protein
VALTAGLFSVVMACLVFTQWEQMRRVDPLNPPELSSLRETFSSRANDVNLKQEIRGRDLAIRRTFFGALLKVSFGIVLIACGVGLMLAVIRMMDLLDRRPPSVKKLVPLEEDDMWKVRSGERRLVALGAVLLLILSLAAVWAVKPVGDPPAVRVAPPADPSDPAPPPLAPASGGVSSAKTLSATSSVPQLVPGPVPGAGSGGVTNRPASVGVADAKPVGGATNRQDVSN